MVDDGLVDVGSAVVEVAVALADSDFDVPDVVGELLSRSKE